MSRLRLLVALAAVLTTAPSASAQLRRVPSPGGGGPDAPGVPRNARFPYEGVWQGMRTMPIGTDELILKFVVTDGAYVGSTLIGGSAIPREKLKATSSGLTWTSPNSGGGTWEYHIRLVGPDSIAGTLVLRDAPPELRPVPSGTLALARRVR